VQPIYKPSHISGVAYFYSSKSLLDSTMRLRSQLLWLVHETFLEHMLRRVYQSWKWNVPLIFLGQTAKMEILYDRRTIEYAKRFLKPDSTILDVGANNGSVLSRLMRVSPKGRYYAYEPIPFFVNYLTKKFPGAVVKDIALSNRTGFANFSNTFGSPALSSLDETRIKSIGVPFKVIQVKTDTLDNQFANIESLSFVKIDVEGHERQVIEGGLATIKRHLPFMVIEISKDSEAFIRKALIEIGYDVSNLLNERDLKILNKGHSTDDVLRGHGYFKASPNSCYTKSDSGKSNSEENF
jgi:FkbM family methyltransferase